MVEPLKGRARILAFAAVSVLLGGTLAISALVRCAGDTDGCQPSGRDTVVALVQAVGVLVAIGLYARLATRGGRALLWAIGLLIAEWSLFFVADWLIPGVGGDAGS